MPVVIDEPRTELLVDWPFTATGVMLTLCSASGSLDFQFTGAEELTEAPFTLFHKAQSNVPVEVRFALKGPDAEVAATEPESVAAVAAPVNSQPRERVEQKAKRRFMQKGEERWHHGACLCSAWHSAGRLNKSTIATAQRRTGMAEANPAVFRCGKILDS